MATGIDRKVERDSNRETLKKLLKSLGELRQAKLTPETENLYIAKLLGYDIRHVSEGIMQLAMEPRGEFQTALPDIGTIIGRVESIRDQRTFHARFVACEQDGCKGGHLRIKDALYTYVAECECLRRWRGGEQASMPDPMDEHLRDVQDHPERFVPVDACIQVGKALGMARKARAGSANPMADEEFYALKKRLIAEMNERWQAQLGSDRKTVAAGA